jgi:hypothetical protein
MGVMFTAVPSTEGAHAVIVVKTALLPALLPADGTHAVLVVLSPKLAQPITRS